MRFPTMWYVRPAKPRISLRTSAVCSEPLLVALIYFECYATDRTAFGVGGCTGSSESTHVKIPHCWKSHVVAHTFLLGNKKIKFKLQALILRPDLEMQEEFQICNQTAGLCQRSCQFELWNTCSTAWSRNKRAFWLDH